MRHKGLIADSLPRIYYVWNVIIECDEVSVEGEGNGRHGDRAGSDQTLG
jgi:hypothetical protein